MFQAQTFDELEVISATVLPIGTVTEILASDPPTAVAPMAVSICIVCCSTMSMPYDTAIKVAAAMKSLAEVRTILLSETGCEETEEVEVIAVPRGTKLSKIRRLAALITADLFCICDPDLTVDEDACRTVLHQAIADVQTGKEVVAFGIVEGRDDGTLISQVIIIDKWISHRVIRRFLWAAGLGITLPGQFLIVSPGLLRSIEHGVDSYLDDIYLGWVARQRGVFVRRVTVVVAREDPRSSWISLVTQRVRWMRGLVSLIGHLSPKISALCLLGIHFIAYHGLPILAMIALLGLTFVNLLVGACVVVGMAAVLSIMSRQSFLASVAFLSFFPFVHVLAILIWWMPLKRSVLTRR